MTLLALVIAAACSESRGGSASSLVPVAADAVETMGLTGAAPSAVRSKDHGWVVATGTAMGDEASIVEAMTQRLNGAAWTFRDATALGDVPDGSQRSLRHRFTQDDLVLTFTVYGKRGSNVPPAGGKFVQVSLARRGTSPAWADID